ncbi:serine hydrolase [Acetobacter fallax]|uniref:Serine hydrolase n=1 Tax=Acetobacter fallax TaxID=1737473 RepID=A0ABX0KGX4_9PROT|nr:serine hydrolase [Acetobacter fallax]NHO34424.1 serine hydrolase [Acetobacter fallax]NHO37981.1 serine hydrolase [Acetobacter fallax]
MFSLVALPAQAAPSLPKGLTQSEIDSVVERTRDAFRVPGIAVAVVQDGQVVFARGYGRRSENTHSESVDARTLFAIGSNTKEFTTTALALLVDEGKLKWNDRVIDHMPEFRVSDPWITKEFRISDLLTHHSGMGLGAGDLMLFSHSTMSRAEVVAALPYMPFTAPFRSDYAYNNLLYVTAGALIEKITGKNWEEFIQTRLINAAGLPACQSTPPVRGEVDVATGEGEEDGHLPDRASLRLPAVAPAGGIWCSLDGLSRWVQTYLNGGKTPEGKTIISMAQRDAVWAPHVLLPPASTAEATESHFRAYGYGWFVEDFFGKRRVWHTGTIDGMVSYVSFLPELHSGIIVLTNHDDHRATFAIATTLSSLVATGTSADWVRHWKDEENATAATQARFAASTGPGSPIRPFIHLSSSDQQDYVGLYHDNWRGDIHVTKQADALRLSFDRSDGLSGALFALPHDLFVVRWDNRAQDAGDDCYVQFHRDVTGKITDMSMQVIGSDFSFDAQDLHPWKISDQP